MCPATLLAPDDPARIRKEGVTHYHGEGEVKWSSGRRGARTTIVLRGWAICCTGDHAQRVWEEGRSTSNRAHVTCKACRRLLARVTRPDISASLRKDVSA